ncbi:MAG: hypothetical protein EXR30_05385 [Betaproteobacteria bacterium]|nr:hypothetical protein [Betaproteobacteria bacterium]
MFDFATAHQMPIMYELDFIIRDGGLISYAPDLEESLDRVAHLVDRILNREPRRGQRQPGHRAGRAQRARRPHPGDGNQFACRQRQPVQQTALRPGQGLRPGDPGGNHGEHPAGASVCAGEFGAGTDRAGQGTAWQAQLRLRRQRHHQPPSRRTVQDHGRRRDGARALQRRRRRLHRPNLGSGATVLRRHPGHRPIPQGRALARARRHHATALAGRAGGADDCRVRLARLFRNHLVGILAPAGTPQPVVARIDSKVARILKMPEVRAKLDAQGFDPVASTSESFGAFMRSEIELWARAVKPSGARAE